MMIPLVILGGFMSLVGVLSMARGREDLARRRRILSTPTSRITEAQGGLVEIAGRLVVGEKGTLTAPFSGRQAVFVRVLVEEYRQRGKSGTWVTVFSESMSREFYVEDGSGERARIDPTGARFVLDRQKIASSGTFRDPPPALAEFLAQHGLESTSWLGFNKSMRYEEELVAVGDTVYALGPSRREAGPPALDGYRTGATTQVVLASMGTGDGELLVSNKAEKELVSKMLRVFVVGAVVAALGLAVVAAGLLASG
jgi:hypothetical protein